MLQSSLIANGAFGPSSTLSDNVWGIAIIAISVCVFGGLGWGILKLLRLSNQSSRSSQQQIVKKAIGNPAKAGEPLATFRFTTYTGFVFWMNQTVSEYRVPASQAGQVLNGLLRHNLTRGLLGPGLIFVPILTLVEYWQRSRTIAEQNVRGFEVERDLR